MKISTLLILFLILNFPIFAQLSQPEEPFIRCLVLQMTGKKRNVNFYEGSTLVVKLHHDKQKYSFEIIRLTDSSFFYAPYEDFNMISDLKEVKFKDIKKVFVSNGTPIFAMKGIGALGSAGLMLSTIDILNQLRGSTVKINPTITGVSAGLIGLSFIMKILTKEHYKINKRHYFHLYHLEKNSRKL